MKPPPTEQALFAEVLQCQTPEARAAFLDGACKHDAALRERIERLLRAADKAGDFLEKPPAGLQETGAAYLFEAELTEKPGDRIGRYKLLEKIGEGGCGVVYMVEQEEPVHRRVALKIIKLGMDTRSVIARFEAERQALALMDHSNIAKVFDGGATPAGRPYFVMELVRGVRITEFCDKAKLSTEARLRLFIQVCQAIQHAHHKGIIHRDLKPSNVLVTVNDGVPVPKVIDFGIAKATGQRLTNKTLFTHFHAFIGTPAYTSPEQAEMSSVDIDTRSDIYSLGVLLYELLTGRTPFDSDELLRSGLDEMRRTIRDELPPPPSSRLTHFVAADARKLSPESPMDGASMRRALQERRNLACVVRGDLDWIVMKCLEKDRSRRYDTASNLAADIQRHLHHEPVTARPPSTFYWLQKLALRHRASLIMGGLGLTLLIASVLGLAVSYAQVRRERNEKDAALAAARASEGRAREQLFVSLKSQAQARRNSREIGQRFESLAALAEAARIRPDVQLRDNAIAAMAIPDIRRGPILPSPHPHTAEIAFDPRYERCAHVDTNGLVVIRSLSDHRELGRLRSSASTAGSVADYELQFSPNGHLIFCGHQDGNLHLWEWESGRLILQTYISRNVAAAFSPDSRLFAVGQENSIVCYDLTTGEENRRWATRDVPFMLAFNPDNKRLAIGYNASEVVSIHDARDGRRLADLPVGPSGRERIAWHPDGQLLAAAGSDPRIQIWDAAAQRKVAVLEGHFQQVSLLAFHPGGQMLVSLSWDNVLRVWHPAPGRLLMRLPALAWTGFSQDGQWAGVTSTSNQQSQLWGLTSSQEYHTFVGTSSDRGSALREGDISPDGSLLALGTRDGVGLWDLDRGREVAHVPMRDTTMALFSGEGSEVMTCGASDGLQRWPVTGKITEGTLQMGPPKRIPLPFAPMRMAIAADGGALAIVGERGARLLQLATGKNMLPDMPHPRADFIGLASKGKHLATSGWHSDRVKLWDTSDGTLVKEWVLGGLTSRIFFTPDHREVIIARSQAFIFRDVKSGEVSRQIPREPGLYPGYIAFGPDGKLMAMELAPGLIHLKETASGKTVAILEDPHRDLSTWMCFTPDGAQLVVAASYAGAIHRWDLRAIRKRLKTMNLDWDWPEFSPAEKPVPFPAVGAESPVSRFSHHE